MSPLPPTEGFRRNTSKQLLKFFGKGIDKQLGLWYNIGVRKRGNKYETCNQADAPMYWN